MLRGASHDHVRSDKFQNEHLFRLFPLASLGCSQLAFLAFPLGLRRHINANQTTPIHDLIPGHVWPMIDDNVDRVFSRNKHFGEKFAVATLDLLGFQNNEQKHMVKVLTYNLFGIRKQGHFFVERLQPLKEVILRENADILCLQEAHPEQVSQLLTTATEPQYELCYTLTEALAEGKGQQNLPARKYSEQEKEFLKVHGVAMILLKKSSGYRVVEKRLVFEGDFVDCGAICIKLRRERKDGGGEVVRSDEMFIYNCHFTGGSYGLEEFELQRRRQYRTDQYRMLLQDIRLQILLATEQEATAPRNSDGTNRQSATPSLPVFIVMGDFNSDPDKLGEYPEASQALELAFTNMTTAGGDKEAHNSPYYYTFTDVWKAFQCTKGGKESDATNEGATESTSRNKFRAFLKPRQQREVRFDRIIVGTSSLLAAHAPMGMSEGAVEAKTRAASTGIVHNNFNKIRGEVHLVGDSQIAKAVLGTSAPGQEDEKTEEETGATVATSTIATEAAPLYPSDHFGVCANIHF